MVKSTRSQNGRPGHHLFFLAAMITSGPLLRVWVHNGPHLSRSCSRPLMVPLCKVIFDARRTLSSLDNEGGAHPVTRNAGKRAISVRLLLVSLASGICGFTIAKTTAVPLLSAVITENDAQESQYGTSKDVQHAIKELRSTFAAKDAVYTDSDNLRAHSISRWDHRTGV